MTVSSLKTPVLIIGAGPTGLGAAWALTCAGVTDWQILECEKRPGGLSRSFRDAAGFTWDLGGHVVFSHYDTFDALLDELIAAADWLRHDRSSWVRILGRWIPYPLQNNLWRLPADARAQCLEGLIQAALHRSDAPFKTFDDLIVRIFGEGIADVFLRPDNRKRWTCDPKEMAPDWTGDRVAMPDLQRVLHNITHQQDDVSWGPNNRFRFPRVGGTGAIWEALANHLPARNIRYSVSVDAVDTQRKRLHLSGSDETIAYGTLLSTMPLDRLAGACGRSDWSAAADHLRHNAVHIIGLGLRGSPGAAVRYKCWTYFPESDTPFFRVTHFSRYSPENVPDIETQWSLMAEVTESIDHPRTAEETIDKTIQGLMAHGLIDHSHSILHTWHHWLPYGYPIPTAARDKVIESLLPDMARQDIYSRGRFGAWRYEVGNMDHCLMQGVEVVRRLLVGSPEWTLWRPHVVNTPHPTLGWSLNP